MSAILCSDPSDVATCMWVRCAPSLLADLGRYHGADSHQLPHHSSVRLSAECTERCSCHMPTPDQPVHTIVGELKTGYLEKRVGEHSGRQSVPLGESFKWQKRYFVLTEPKGMLYYFKSADDPPNYRGVINLRRVP